MNLMSASVESADLLDLKLLPAWVKESGAAKHYDHYTAEEQTSELRSRDRHTKRKGRRLRSREPRADRLDARSRSDNRHRGRMPKTRGDGRRPFDRAKNRRSPDRDVQPPRKLPVISIRFLPRQSVFENVITQIKSASVAFSLF